MQIWLPGLSDPSDAQGPNSDQRNGEEKGRNEKKRRKTETGEENEINEKLSANLPLHPANYGLFSSTREAACL